LSCDTRW